MNDKISIIVAIFNVEEYLPRCLESIMKQDYYNLDIILVDDGSTDSSADICDAYCKKDSRFRCIHKKNGGLSEARNYGIEAAVGKYISFIDGDDCINPSMYNILYTEVKRNDVKIGACSFQTFSHNEEISYKSGKVNGKIITPNEVLNILHSDARTDIITACCKLYMKDLFSSIRFPVGRYREDEFTTYKVVLSTDKIYYTKAKLYYYYQRYNSIMHIKNVKKETDYYDALLERNKYLLENFGDSEDLTHNDTLFCMKQLYNVFFLNLQKSEFLTYIKEYSTLYDKIYFKYKIKEKGFIRYCFARYFPTTFRLIWKVKSFMKNK